MAVLQILVTLLLLLGGADLLAAQGLVPTAARRAVPAEFGVRPGRTVRVAVAGEGRLAGTVMASDERGFVLSTDGGDRRFAALPDTLWTRGRAVAQGAVVGGIVGVGAGVLLGLFGNAMCEYDCGPAAGDAALGALLVGASGAALGALVGAAIPRWQRRLP
jgi:hypothetical protein